MLSPLSRRTFLERTLASAAAFASARRARAAEESDLKAIQAAIEKRHDESVHRLQDWIRQPSIAAENRGMSEGCDLMMRLLRDAGFSKVSKKAALSICLIIAVPNDTCDMGKCLSSGVHLHLSLLPAVRGFSRGGLNPIS